MAELSRPARESFDSGSPLDAFLDGEASGAGLVMISSGGLYNENLPVAGMTVGEVRARFRDRLDIDPNAASELDGRPASDAELVRAGQLLAFVRHAGEKGRARF